MSLKETKSHSSVLKSPKKQTTKQMLLVTLITNSLLKRLLVVGKWFLFSLQKTDWLLRPSARLVVSGLNLFKLVMQLLFVSSWSSAVLVIYNSDFYCKKVV